MIIPSSCAASMKEAVKEEISGVKRIKRSDSDIFRFILLIRHMSHNSTIQSFVEKLLNRLSSMRWKICFLLKFEAA